MPTSAKTRSQDKGVAVITLLPEQAIHGVRLLHAELCVVLNSAARGRLAAVELVYVDTATLQLLCAFMLESRQRGVEVEWDTPSEALSSAARLLGISGMLAAGVARVVRWVQVAGGGYGTYFSSGRFSLDSCHGSHDAAWGWTRSHDGVRWIDGARAG